MTIEALVAAVLAMVFNVPADVARTHVEAAKAAADKHHLPVELLLGMTLIESNFDASSVSRMECDKTGCKRVAGPWAPSTPPPGARPTFYCGPMQTGGNITWEACQQRRNDIEFGYETGAQELTIWMRDPHCNGLHGDDRTRCALAGYNAGYAGVEARDTLKYPGNVLWASLRIKQLAEFQQKQAEKPRS